MRHFGGLVHAIGGFARDRSGNFAVLFGLVGSVLALGAGFAVNVSQLYNARSSLQGVVDAAVTSTARDQTTAHREADANKSVQAFLDANSKAGILQADQIVLDKLTVDKIANTVQADVRVDVGLYFPIFGLGDMQRVTASTTALYSDKRVEVAMMLDITGSMKKIGKKDKIGDLRAAASNAVTDLLKGNRDPNNPRIRVAIVPYAEAVNTGGLAKTVFVETKNGSKVPPPIDAPVSVSSATPAPDKCATERKDKDGYANSSSDGPNTPRLDNENKTYLAKVNRDYRMGTCPAAALIPLTANEDKLLKTITDFKADGVTAGGIAAQWGYYMLSPSWRPTIADAGLGAGPANFDKKKVAKVAILMTDGQFNTAFARAPDAPKSQDKAQMSRGNAEDICSNMKRDGIEVFTIGFDLNDPTMSATEKDQAKKVLKDCSTADTSSLKHYYEAATGPELDQAFSDIITNIEKLTIKR